MELFEVSESVAVAVSLGLSKACLRGRRYELVSGHNSLLGSEATLVDIRC